MSWPPSPEVETRSGAARALWSSPLIALEFLTPLRLRRVQRWDDRTFGAAIAWYPLVGLLMGVALLLIDRGLERLLPPAPTAALEVAALALLSGGLHLDGVADTADGMALQGDRAERLGVMSEGHTGPAGVMSLVIVLLVLWAALVSLAPPVRSAGWCWRRRSRAGRWRRWRCCSARRGRAGSATRCTPPLGRCRWWWRRSSA